MTGHGGGSSALLAAQARGCISGIAAAQCAHRSGATYQQAPERVVPAGHELPAATDTTGSLARGGHRPYRGCA